MQPTKQRLSDLKTPARGTIEAAVDGYLGEIATVRSRAKDGIPDAKTPQGLHVRHTMSFFVPFMRERGIARMDEIETSDLIDFLAHAKELRKTRTKRQKQEDGKIVETIVDCGLYSETTIHGWMKDVRALMFYAKKRKLIKEEQPWDEKMMPKLPRATKRGMSTQEVATMLDLPNLSTREGVRDQALLTLTLDVGPRLSSIAKLVVGDITRILGGYRVHFRDPKNGKDLTVTLGRTASEAMQDWLRMRGEEDPKGPLWLSRRRPLTRSGVAQALRRYGKQIGIVSNPHRYRHTCAQLHHAEGMQVVEIKELLGHSNIVTTLAYMDGLDERAAASHKEHNALDALARGKKTLGDLPKPTPKKAAKTTKKARKK